MPALRRRHICFSLASCALNSDRRLPEHSLYIGALRYLSHAHRTLAGLAQYVVNIFADLRERFRGFESFDAFGTIYPSAAALGHLIDPSAWRDILVTPRVNSKL